MGWAARTSVGDLGRDLKEDVVVDVPCFCSHCVWRRVWLAVGCDCDCDGLPCSFEGGAERESRD
jgi:hypothetical protein